jgi:hypothetical protein
MRRRVWARNLNFQLPKWVGVTFVERASRIHGDRRTHSVNISMAEISVLWCHVALQFLSAGAVTNITLKRSASDINPTHHENVCQSIIALVL